MSYNGRLRIRCKRLSKATNYLTTNNQRWFTAMFWTRTLIPTMKETPEGAEIPSHVLMLRAGLINQVMAGAYTYLPLGLRALKKAERIVREEMDAAGAVELVMPAMTPRGLWEQTGRVAAFGDVLIQLTLNRPPEPEGPRRAWPTHEEIITDLVSRQINSYRQMPITLYQISARSSATRSGRGSACCAPASS